MKYLPILILLLFSPVFLLAQDELLILESDSAEGKTYVTRTFRDTRVINSHSIETLKKRKLDFRVSHRFGDIAGSNGGWATLYGLENAADIMIGFEYGITDDLMIGFNRTKGDGPLRQLLNGFLKYRLFKQTEDNKMPLSITLLAGSTISTMKKSDDEFVLNHFDKFSHRMMYVYQAVFGRKFGDVFSLQLTGSYVHRNIVNKNDENNLFSAGLAIRIPLNKAFAIILDTTYPISDLRTFDNGYYFPLGIGLEIYTGGHTFQVNFTNAKAISEIDYISNSKYNWGDGQFRLGFTISRRFII